MGDEPQVNQFFSFYRQNNFLIQLNLSRAIVDQLNNRPVRKSTSSLPNLFFAKKQKDDWSNKEKFKNYPKKISSSRFKVKLKLARVILRDFRELSSLFAFHSFYFLELFTYFCVCFKMESLWTIYFKFFMTYFWWVCKKVEIFFSIPTPCDYTSSPLDGMARNIHFLSTWIRKSTHFGLDPFYPTTLYTREKNHLDNAGIEPGSPALQASTLSIMPSPLGPPLPWYS